jgi:hypothetical protein
MSHDTVLYYPKTLSMKAISSQALSFYSGIPLPPLGKQVCGNELFIQPPLRQASQ